MARVPDVPPEEQSPRQKQIAEEIVSKRSSGVPRGPFAIWLRQPELADRANKLGNILRAEGKLEKRLFELMVLIIARHWSAQYEWYAHARQGIEAGLTRESVEALRAGKVPAFARADEQLIYDVITELNTTRTLGQATYDRALAALGLDLLIELIAAAGFYTMVAMTLNAFDAPVPGGELPFE